MNDPERQGAIDLAQILRTHVNDPERQGAIEVAHTLRTRGFEAWFAGGCVRDLLLGGRPKDWDIATDATPQEVQSIFPKTLAVGAAFGVIAVLWPGKRTYEVATFRADGDYSDGRRPDTVIYSKAREEDVLRRDFTINALLMDPLSEEILDYVDGRVDLVGRLVRAVGDPARRFKEDRLRMLRAVRFASRLGFSIEPETWLAICNEALELKVVSPERITQELEGIFRRDGSADAIKLLIQSGLSKVSFPAQVIPELEKRFRRLSDELLAAEEHSELIRIEISWSLLHCMYSDVEVEPLLRSRKLSKKTIRRVQEYLRVDQAAQAPKHDELPNVSLLRWARQPMAQGYRAYLWCKYGEEANALRRFDEALEFLQSYPPSDEAILSGADLKGLGMTPGPHFKRLLADIEGAALRRELTTKAEAIKYAEGWIKNQDESSGR